MEIEQFNEEHRQMVEKLGGYAAIQRRLVIQKIYFLINLRAKKDKEHLDIVDGDRLVKIGYPVDFYTETGIARLRIPAHSCMELKAKIVSDTVYRFNEFAKLYLSQHPGAKVYLLYQDKGDLTEKLIRESKRQHLAEIYQVNEFLERVDKVAMLTDKVAKFEQDWKVQREAIIESAKVSFREDKCSFFLGAGVSMSAGGPSWKELLQKIMRHFKKITKRSDFDKIYEWCGMSPIILGRYAASNEFVLKKVSDYLRRYVLYRNVNTSNSRLIQAICDAVQGEEDERIVAQGKLDSIITYNYDDLVEMALEARGVEVARIYLKSRNKRKEFPVYHVHGLISQEENGIVSTPILGEKEYHQMYKESYHWSNVEQLHALDRSKCFFIGLSMTDPNLRRLLDISRVGSDNDYRHFAFLQRKPMYDLYDVDKNANHFNTIEYQLSDLGVQVIWYENHDEVPEMIKRIIAPMQYIG